MHRPWPGSQPEVRSSDPPQKWKATALVLSNQFKERPIQGDEADVPALLGSAGRSLCANDLSDRGTYFAFTFSS
jgi:hypothetical protein